MVAMPAITTVAAIMWGIALVLGGFFLSNTSLLIIFTLNTLLLYSISGGSNLFFLFCIAGIPALIMGLRLHRKNNYYTLQKWGMVTVTLCITMFLAMVFINSGSNIINDMENISQRYVEESMKWSEDSGIMDFYKDKGVEIGELEESMQLLAEWIVKHLPAFLYLKGIAVVFLILYLAAYISSKRGWECLDKKPYNLEIMPWYFVWIVITGLALWIWGKDEMNSCYYIGSNILLISVPITVYYGMALLVYKIKQVKKKNKKWLITAIIVLALVFPPSLIMFIALLGLFDSLLDYRKLRSNKEVKK